MYRAIETSIWDDPKIKGLHPTAKLAFLYLLTNRHTHVSGIYVLSSVLPPHETGIPASKWDTLWDTLSGVGLAQIDPKTDVVWVEKMFGHQGKGQKNEQSAAKHLLTLHNSFLIRDFLTAYPSVNQYLSPGVSDRVSDRGSEVGVQEQEKEKEQEQEKDLRSASPNGQYPDGFERWWKDYPPRAGSNRGSKKDAAKHWKRDGLEAQTDEQIEILAKFKTCREWMDGFNPQAQVFLNKRLYEDPPGSVVPTVPYRPVISRRNG